MNDTHTRFRHFRVDTDIHGVATVTLDVQGRPLNVFDDEVLAELGQIVSLLETRGETAMVVFRSGKESGFLAGADVRAIRGLVSRQQVERVLMLGQQLFTRVEQLPMPTVAAIHGPCLGGGLEFALACDYRIARDNSSTQIGLPEIKLGLIPGWGGTQRLPRLIGGQAALDLILRGRSLDARETHQIGLADRAVSPLGWEGGIESFVADCLGGRLPRRGGLIAHCKRKLADNAVARRLACRIAFRRLAAQRRHYPAISAAIRAVAAADRRNLDGMAIERQQFLEVWDSPTSGHLIDLFLHREAARQPATWVPGQSRLAHDRPVRTLGVVGAGAMGAGIGQLAAHRGFRVTLLEVDEAAAEAGRERVGSLFRRLAQRKQWPPEQLETALRSVRFTCDTEDLEHCDLVVEAVIEDEPTKHEVFRRLQDAVQASAVLATNTSSLSVDSMASVTLRGEKVAGLHFFNPVHRMELVEVVRGGATDDETVAKLLGFVRALGKTPIVTSDSPGFLVNRVLFPYLGEAVMMLREGVDIAKIDREVRQFGMPMGPLELLDQVGIDVAWHVARSLRPVLAEAETVTDSLGILVDQQRLGKKSGYGFYRYRRGRRREAVVLPPEFPRQYRPASADRFVDDGMTLVQRRAIYPMLAEAVRCLEGRVVANAWAIDLGMVLGTGFAPHTGGPLHLIDQIGAANVLENLHRLAALYGPRYQPPGMLERVANDGSRFIHTPGRTGADGTRRPPTVSGDASASAADGAKSGPHDEPQQERSEGGTRR